MGASTPMYAGGNPTINIDPTGEVIQVAIGGGTSVAMGWAIAKLTGQCYSGNDVVLDAALGAAGVGIFNKARSIYRISKLRAIAKEDGMIMTATQKGVEKYVGEGTSIEIKSVGNILSPGGQLNNSGSWFPRARYKVAPGSPDGVPKSYLDPFSGKTGPLRSDAAHIPLEATIGEAAALGGGVGAAVNPCPYT